MQNQWQPLYRDQSSTLLAGSYDFTASSRTVGYLNACITLEKIPTSSIEVFVFELYSPYTDVFQNYATYEQEQLKAAFDAVQLVSFSRLEKVSHEMRTSR